MLDSIPLASAIMAKKLSILTVEVTQEIVLFSRCFSPVTMCNLHVAHQFTINVDIVFDAVNSMDTDRFLFNSI